MTDSKKYNSIYFALKFVCAIFLGIVISFVVIQNDDSLKYMLEKRLEKYLCTSFGCNVSCKIDSINLFYPKIKFKQIKMNSQGKSFAWNGNSVEIGFAWLDIFLSGAAEMYINIGDIDIHSSIEKNGLSIMPHLMAFFEGSSLSVATIVKSFCIKNGALHFTDEFVDSCSNIYFSSTTKNMLGVYKTKILFSGGDFSVYAKQIVDRLSGALSVSSEKKSGNLYIDLESRCSFDAQFLHGNKTCFLTGNWSYDQGLFSVISQDKTFSITPIKLYFLGETLFTEVNLESGLSDIFGFLFHGSQDLSGKCRLKLSSEFGPIATGFSGSVIFKDVYHKSRELFSFGRITCKKISNEHKGFLSFARKDGVIINGGLNFSQDDNTFSCNIINDTDIRIPLLPDWRITPKKAKLRVSRDNSGCWHGNYCCCALHEKLENTIDVCSDITLDQNICSLHGKVNKKKYDIDLLVNPKIRIKKFALTNESNDEVLKLHALQKDPNKFVSSVKFPFLKSLAKEYLGLDIKGEGDLNMYGMVKDDLFLCQLVFKNGSASFPGFYNFLNTFKINCKVDPNGRTVDVKNAQANLHKGCVTCKNAVLRYDEFLKPMFMYAPFIVDNCFVNWNNDFFALCSGRLLFSKKENSSAKLQGLTIIERSQLKRNIFSQTGSDKYAKMGNAFLRDIDCDISVITKNPTRVNTSFLKTGAKVDLFIKNKLFDPHMEGKIDFVSGVLIFPYKPLNISKGSIYFLPHQSGDPLIELIAKNKINKYNISMSITGSFSNYHISLESSPTLSEEQIFALLIAGSAQESLNVVAPALIMQQVKDSLFGSGESKVGKKNYFGKFLKPFRNVHIVPSFTDQTGRGGLRGAIEVDINDRWRAFVQKNFSLSEDTRFEIEYLLSDDVSIRGFRRENGDIGGDVEMRWKL